VAASSSRSGLRPGAEGDARPSTMTGLETGITSDSACDTSTHSSDIGLRGRERDSPPDRHSQRDSRPIRGRPRFRPRWPTNGVPEAINKIAALVAAHAADGAVMALIDPAAWRLRWPTSPPSCNLYLELLFGTGRADVSVRGGQQRNCRRQASHSLKADSPVVPVSR
jgi:hypothetical protein